MASLTPLSVDGMIGVVSTTLLSDSRSGCPRRCAIGGRSVASLAANVAVAEPRATGREIAAWPSFALIGSYEMLMRQVPAFRCSCRPPGREIRSDTWSAGSATMISGGRGHV